MLERGKHMQRQQHDAEVRTDLVNALHGEAKAWRRRQRKCAEEREACECVFIPEELRRGKPARERNANQQAAD